MPLFAQHLLVGAVILAAAAYLVRVAWKTMAAKSGCGCAGKPCARIAEMNRAVEHAPLNPPKKGP